MAYNFNYIEGDEPVPGYRLIGFLGEGGFGKVWKAAAPGGTEVALKIIRLGGTQGRKEFRALQLVKLIRHPNLVPVVSFWVKDADGRILDDALTGQGDLPIDETAVVAPSNQTMMVQPAADGLKPAELIIAMGLGDQSLFDRLEDCQAQGLEGIPLEELLNYMEGAAEAIDFLNRPIHDLGSGQVAIQHCDIKPHNLMTVGGATQICDFGLSRVMGTVRTTTATAGTIAYAAPECLREGKPSPTTDQYSLAVSYFELRTGTLPYENETFAGVTNAVIQGSLELSKLPPAERDVIRRATMREPAKRYSTAADMVRALRQAALGTATGATASSTRFPRFAVTLMIVAVIACGAYFFRYILPNHRQIAQQDRGHEQAAPAQPEQTTAAETGTQESSTAEPSTEETKPEKTSTKRTNSEKTVPGEPGAGPAEDSPETMAQTQVGQIEELVRQGRYDEAVASATDAIAENPDDARLFHLRGTARLESREWQEAADDFSEALGIDPQAVDYVDRGRAYLAMEQLDQAEDDFHRVLDADPRNPDAQFGLGLLHVERGNYEEAIRVFEELIDRDDAPQYVTRQEYARAYLERGTGFLVAGLEGDPSQWDLAVADFQQGIRHDPHDYRLFSRLGTIQLARQQWAEAVDSFTSSLDIDEGAGGDYVNRGAGLLRLDAVDKALTDFQRAIDLNDQNADAHYLLGECYRTQKKYGEAIEPYTRAIENYDHTDGPIFDLAHAYLYRGACHLATQQLDAAATDFDRALQPPEAAKLGDVGGTLDGLADAFADEDRYQEAIRWTETAIRLTRDATRQEQYQVQLEEYQKANQ